MSRFQYLVADSKNGVRTITLRRPEKLNALTPEMIEELIIALRDAETCECGVVILTGAGQAFCAGLDIEHLEMLNADSPEANRNDSENIARLLRTLYEFPKPVIAAVNGPAIAVGMSLATIPDFTLATPESKFGFNEVRVGFVPAIEASFLLRQIGEKRTRELLICGRMVKAHEALQLGLVTRLVAADELMQSAHALAQGLLLNSPQAMHSLKHLLAQHASKRLDEEIEEAISINALQRSMEDFKEGVEAFKRRRRPEWPSRHAKV
ncbi:MAG TPA: enoyl-CoA hydratase/isomerase family protein [Terracidiphilus sp.]|jgi:methylglutaconyl-CoA hydratase|nr:enoyl-CoA hydratase/isomerase family protein [Terracidiphilus sp.]